MISVRRFVTDDYEIEFQILIPPKIVVQNNKISGTLEELNPISKLSGVWLSRQECFDELNSLYNDKAPSYSTVKNWYNEFNRGRCSIQDESRAGRPKSVVVPEKINAVRELIKQDRHVTYREIEASLDISVTSINKILHEHLSVKKICSRWIPHNLTNAQKKARVDWCKEMLEKYIQGTSKAVYNIYTGEESWIYAYEPETKQQSTVWVFQDEAKPTKVVRGRSTSKQMIACFFGINGHVATVALEQRRTVNSEWYTTICLPEVIGEIRKKQKNRRIILHHDNASSHTSTQTKAFLTERKIELMGHPPLTEAFFTTQYPVILDFKTKCLPNPRNDCERLNLLPAADLFLANSLFSAGVCKKNNATLRL
ncbi:histone-lysine N-methyltransferase SETMAR [Nephila pilipes]|uniref:Histone-lysine N-methyltransferase SETMAR n=1 Tax=Nephila pilipes TaxID=299642 RepID=A0A8X6PNL8_NEPPI|nr:histone-lysine N-methyltransferase SETMAR [Nephila pilipes]